MDLHWRADGHQPLFELRRKLSRTALGVDLRKIAEIGSSADHKSTPECRRKGRESLQQIFLHERIHLRSVHVGKDRVRSEEHTSELQSQFHLVCRLLLEKKK